MKVGTRHLFSCLWLKSSLFCTKALLFFLKASFIFFFFFFCSSCFNCAQEMVDHHHHLFLWKNLGWVHRARHYSLASLVPQQNKMLSEEVFLFWLNPNYLKKQYVLLQSTIIGSHLESLLKNYLETLIVLDFKLHGPLWAHGP